LFALLARKTHLIYSVAWPILLTFGRTLCLFSYFGAICSVKCVSNEFKLTLGAIRYHRMHTIDWTLNHHCIIYILDDSSWIPWVELQVEEMSCSCRKCLLTQGENHIIRLLTYFSTLVVKNIVFKII